MAKNYLLAALVLIIILAVLLFIYKSQDLRRAYRAEVLKGLAQTSGAANSALTAEEIKHLPQPVQRYLKYVGVIGQEKVKNVKAVFKGEMKLDRNKDWVKIESEQYNFFDKPTRMFYIQAKMAGIPIIGLHSYTNARAIMLIKVAGLITVADGRGEIMNKSETVTVFNDMCLLAPASLIDKRIRWETVDPLTVKAEFDNDGIKINAVLYFNEKGELVNFVSNDRYFSPDGKSYENVAWSTPVKDYQETDGVKHPSYGEAIWHFPEGDFCYAKFDIEQVASNLASMQ